MLIIGCDFHTRYQQIAMMDEATGELVERRLDHQSGEAHAFYRNLQGPVRVGIEATGPTHWFERLLAELGHELWIGDAARIRASEVRKQKTDQRDALLILDLLLAKRFPKIWVPTPAERDLRQLLWHRHKLVCMRTMLGNQLHALAMSQGLCRAISKQGNTMVRWLLIEAVHPAVRHDLALRQHYQRLKFRRGHAVAKVAIARKLAVRMYWMLRSGAEYARLVRRQGSPGGTLVDASSSPC